MNEKLTIHLRKRTARTSEKEARRTGLTKEKVARQALGSRLQRSGKLLVMQRHFGMMRGSPDLSTNKSCHRSWNKKEA